MKIQSLKTGEIREVSPETWRAMQANGRARVYRVINSGPESNVEIKRLFREQTPEEIPEGIIGSPKEKGLGDAEFEPLSDTGETGASRFAENIESDTEEEPKKGRKRKTLKTEKND